MVREVIAGDFKAYQQLFQREVWAYYRLQVSGDQTNLRIESRLIKIEELTLSTSNESLCLVQKSEKRQRYQGFLQTIIISLMKQL